MIANKIFDEIHTTARILKLATYALALCGFGLTSVLFVMGMRYGIVSLICVISLVPYLLAIFGSRRVNTIGPLVLLLVVLFCSVTGGNYIFFKAVVLAPSGSASDVFALSALMEILLLSPIIGWAYWKRSGKGSAHV